MPISKRQIIDTPSHSWCVTSSWENPAYEGTKRTGSGQTLRFMRGILSEPERVVTYEHYADNTYLGFCTIKIKVYKIYE